MKKIIISVSLLLIGFVAAYLIYMSIIFHVQSTNPANGGVVRNGTDKIVITFSKNIQDVKLEDNIIASDNIIFGVSTVKNQLIIQVRNLDINKQYKITLRDIQSTDGKVIAEYNYSFTNQYVDYNKLSENQRKQDLEKQSQNEQNSVNDIATTALPVSTDHYYIQSTILDQPQDNKQIKITIAILVTREQESDTNLIRRYKAEALEFLKQKGINLNNYVVEYVPESATSL